MLCRLQAVPFGVGPGGDRGSDLTGWGLSCVLSSHSSIYLPSNPLGPLRTAQGNSNLTTPHLSLQLRHPRCRSDMLPFFPVHSPPHNPHPPPSLPIPIPIPIPSQPFPFHGHLRRPHTPLQESPKRLNIHTPWDLHPHLPRRKLSHDHAPHLAAFAFQRAVEAHGGDCDGEGFGRGWVGLVGGEW